MKILYVSFEALPFIKVGGLADVASVLPKFIKMKKQNIKLVLPLHKKIDRSKHKIKNLKKEILIPIGPPWPTGQGNQYLTGQIWKTKIPPEIDVYFVENERYFDRDEIYRTPEGDYPDNPERFAFFSKAVLETAKAIGFKPNIIHANDMQTALIPAYLKTIYRIDSFFNKTKTVFTIHNIAYQGLYEPEILNVIGIPPEEFTMEKIEFYGKLNFLKAGIVYSDIITTVSPTYAQEIQTDEEHGMGLQGVLQTRAEDLFGILNGIDYDEWDPSKDKYIISNYSADNFKGKTECKKDLQELCKWKKSDLPIIGMVSRLDPIKGFDLLCEVFEDMMGRDLRLVILGLGDIKYHEIFTELSKRYPEKFKIFLKFDNEMAHKIYAGSDIFLMPSKFEPCGLGQMIASRYATIPLVHKTGGLADAVKDNGFSFEEFTKEAFLENLDLALRTYKNPEAWKRLMKIAAASDFSWKNSVENYLKIYRKALSKK